MVQEKKVGEGKIIELKYMLFEGGPDGELLELMDEQWPLKFLFGSGVMLPVFEENLSPLSEGQKFKFLIAAADAYGEREADQIVQLFKDDLEENPRYPFDNYEEEDLVQFVTNDGRKYSGKIIEKRENDFVVDCNHALAGKDLWFEGQILFVRDARADEIEANRYIEPNGFRSHSTLRLPPNQ